MMAIGVALRHLFCLLALFAMISARALAPQAKAVDGRVLPQAKRSLAQTAASADIATLPEVPPQGAAPAEVVAPVGAVPPGNAPVVVPSTLPARSPLICAPTSRKITPEDNAQVYSEWGHLINVSGSDHEFIRIVKNKDESGYALWYCEATPPKNINYDEVSCWQLSTTIFEPLATDETLKSCKLFEKLRAQNFALPNEFKIKMQLLRGPYPVTFNFVDMVTENFCTGAAAAFASCLKGL